MKRARILILVCLITIFLSGCSDIYFIDDYRRLNQGLTYLPLRDPPSDPVPRPNPSPTTQQASASSGINPCPDVSQTSAVPPQGTLKLLPHMQLRFFYSPLDAASQEGQSGDQSGKNLLIANAFNSAWIIPAAGGPYDGEDFFYFGLLLATGQLNVRDNAVERFNELVENESSGLLKLSDKDFYHQLGQRVLSKSFGTIELSSIRETSPGSDTELLYTAAWVRQWLNEPSKADFVDVTRARQMLRMKAFLADKDGKERVFEVRTFNWSPAYFNDYAPRVATASLCNNWYQAGNFIPRGHGYIKVEIPVLREGDTKSNFYPVWYSVRDWERATGLTILGIRRSKEFLNGVRVSKGKKEFLLESCPPGDSKCLANRFIDTQQYFTIWFANKVQNFGSKAIIVVNDALKEKLLLGARDVIIVGKKREGEPVDAPGRR